jgi:hypothetical protein
MFPSVGSRAGRKATGTSGLFQGTVKVGSTSVINTTAISEGANVVLTTSNITVGNSTVNVAITSSNITGISVIDGGTY